MRRRGIVGGRDGRGLGVFKIAFARWIDESNDRDLSQVMHETLDELKAVAVGKEPSAT